MLQHLLRIRKVNWKVIGWSFSQWCRKLVLIELALVEVMVCET